VEAGVRNLIRIQTFELLYCSLDKNLHELIIYPRQYIFTEEEAYGDEITVKVVHSAAVLFNVSQNFTENWKLSNVRSGSTLHCPLSIQNNH
jgi:hypothetical protein